MPIFMDFHDVPEGITAKHVAEMHQADLKIEHKYNCRGLTYWCDERRQTAFCLIEAPNEQAIIDLHEEAHGDVPQRIIQVNDTIVESFLGRIEDPEKSQNTKLNIINDSAFRVLMVVSIKRTRLRTADIETLQAAIRGYNKSIQSIVNSHDGRVAKQEGYAFLLSFTAVTNAIDSAIKIQDLYNCVITPDLEFNIGISAGIPVSERTSIFEETIHEARSLCYAKGSKIMLTPAVNDLYESENQNTPIAIDGVMSVSMAQKEFVINLLDYTKTVWANADTSALDFSKHLGYSKSKLYRTMMTLFGKSPNNFLKDYRLHKALELLDKQAFNISEIAYQTGFSSPTYFSKCFQAFFGVLPSHYQPKVKR